MATIYFRNFKTKKALKDEEKKNKQNARSINRDFSWGLCKLGRFNGFQEFERVPSMTRNMSDTVTENLPEHKLHMCSMALLKVSSS